MEYLDTSYVVSLVVVNDVNHEYALKIKKMVKDPVISNLVVIELYNFYSRNPDKTLSREISDLRLIVESSVRYTLEKVNAKLVKIDLDKILDRVKELAIELRLKTLDLIHLASALESNVDRFVTFDKDIIKSKNVLREKYGIIVIP